MVGGGEKGVGGCKVVLDGVAGVISLVVMS